MTSRQRSISVGLFCLSTLIFVVCLGSWFLTQDTPHTASSLALPLLIYGLAHVVRAIRLGVLLRAERARHLLWLYLYTAACSIVIPYKLGELVRINEIAWWSGSYWRGVLIVWIERTFDVIAVGTIAALILLSGVQQPRDIGLLLWAIGGFVFVTACFFFILPEQLQSLNLHVIRSYRGAKAVNVLRLLDSCYRLLEQVRPLLSGRIVTLSLLTLIIWGCELAALSLLSSAYPWMSAMENLVQQFTRVLHGGSDHPGTLQADFESLKVLGLLILGMIALALYSRVRITRHMGAR